MSSMVFIFPAHIEFPDNFETQTITIFNPYDFTIHFHFECTRPNAFLLSTTEGDILAKHSLDISVNILDKTIIEEKFQIRTNLPAKGKRLGDKIIKITLKSDKGTEDEGSVRSGKSSKVDHFQELVQTGYERAPAMEYKQLKTDKVPNEYFVYSACLLCLIILFLPQEDRANSSLYMLAVSFNVKLVAAYVLGIVTVFLIRN